MLGLVFRFTVIFPHRNGISLMGFKKDLYNAIEWLTIECCKTKTTIIILANHSKRKQRQSVHGKNTIEQATNLTKWWQRTIKKSQNQHDLINFNNQLENLSNVNNNILCASIKLTLFVLILVIFANWKRSQN